MQKHIIQVKYSASGMLETKQIAGTVVQKNNLVNQVQIYFKTSYTTIGEAIEGLSACLFKLYCARPDGTTVSYPVVNTTTSSGTTSFDNTYLEDGYARVVFDLDERVSLVRGNVECTLEMSEDSGEDDENEVSIFNTDNFRSFTLFIEKSASTEKALTTDTAEELWNKLLKFSENNSGKLDRIHLSGGINKFLDETGNYTFNWYLNTLDSAHMYTLSNPSIRIEGYNDGNSFHPTVYNPGELEQTGRATFSGATFLSNETHFNGLTYFGNENTYLISISSISSGSSLNEVLIKDTDNKMRTVSKDLFISTLDLETKADHANDVNTLNNVISNNYNTLNDKIDKNYAHQKQYIDDDMAILDDEIKAETSARQEKDASQDLSIQQNTELSKENNVKVTKALSDLETHTNESKSMLLEDVGGGVNDETGALEPIFYMADGTQKKVSYDLGTFLTRVTDSIDIYGDSTQSNSSYVDFAGNSKTGTIISPSYITSLKLGDNTFDFSSTTPNIAVLTSTPSKVTNCASAKVISSTNMIEVVGYANQSSVNYALASIVIPIKNPVAGDRYYFHYDTDGSIGNNEGSDVVEAYVYAPISNTPGATTTLKNIADNDEYFEIVNADYKYVFIYLKLYDRTSTHYFYNISITKGETAPSTYTKPSYAGVVPLIELNSLNNKDTLRIEEENEHLVMVKTKYINTVTLTGLDSFTKEGTSVPIFIYNGTIPKPKGTLTNDVPADVVQVNSFGFDIVSSTYHRSYLGDKISFGTNGTTIEISFASSGTMTLDDLKDYLIKYPLIISYEVDSPITSTVYDMQSYFDLQLINSASTSNASGWKANEPIVKFNMRGQRYADIPIIDRYNPPYMSGSNLIITWNGGITTPVDLSSLFGDALHKNSSTIQFSTTENHEIYASVIKGSLDETYFTSDFASAISKANQLYTDVIAVESAESERQANEVVRKANETAREEAEEDRVELYNQMVALKSEVETLRDQLTTLKAELEDIKAEFETQTASESEIDSMTDEVIK